MRSHQWFIVCAVAWLAIFALWAISSFTFTSAVASFVLVSGFIVGCYALTTRMRRAVMSLKLGVISVFSVWVAIATDAIFQARFPDLIQLPLVLLYSAPGAIAIFLKPVLNFPPGHCKKCGYNLTGNTSGVCSECGLKVSV